MVLVVVVDFVTTPLRTCVELYGDYRIFLLRRADPVMIGFWCLCPLLYNKHDRYSTDILA